MNDLKNEVCNDKEIININNIHFVEVYKNISCLPSEIEGLHLKEDIKKYLKEKISSTPEKILIHFNDGSIQAL